MKSDYVYLNNKTFEIEEKNDIVPVKKYLADAISVLNKKGYYVDMFSEARILTPFLIGSIISKLREQELLNINDNTKDKINNIIKNFDCESTIIMFKDEYKFDNLPNGYKLVGKNLIYYLTILKDNDNFEMKKLSELDRENQESFKSYIFYSLEGLL